MVRTQKQIELTNEECLNLHQELTRLSKLNLMIVFKAHINRLKSTVERIVKDYDKIRVELVEKYGKDNGKGLIEIQKVTESGEMTAEYKDFLTEIQLLLADSHLIEYGEILESDFADVKTDDNFPTLYKLL